MIKNKFERLPLGAVRPSGFIKTQLELQKDGITGHMEDYPDYGPDSGWLGGNGESWERGPYYVRGLIALAYSLNDEELINKSYKWIEWALNSQREDGNFGPAAMEKEWWAKMPMLMAIRDFYEAEGYRGNHENDLRILTFFTKYFVYQNNNIGENKLDSWARARGGDNAEVVIWYYEEIKKITGEEKEWLCDLAGIMFKQTEDWTEIFNNTGVRHHVVNTTQAMKTPYLRYKLTGDEVYKRSLKEGFNNIRRDHGRIDNLPNADEAARDNLATRGTESCAVVEGMLSMEICGAITGESYIFDNLESYCYNSLPNAFTYDLRLHTYYQLQNNVMAANGYHGFDCDHGDSSAFGAPCGFDCCFSNSHMGYPKFVQNMWMKTDNGIAAVCYGPNDVETVFDGKRISFRQETGYPFGENIRFIYTGEECNFTLTLRLPLWTKRYSVNQLVSEEGEYIHVEKYFKPGDAVEFTLKSDIEVKNWHHGGRYVKKGVLLYCLPIKEKYKLLNSNDYREIKFEPLKDAPNIEIYPASGWNYALCKDGMKYEEKELNDGQCYSPENYPCCIKAKGQILSDWVLEGNKAGQFDPDGIQIEADKLEDLILIPYGASRLKISVFPRAEEKIISAPEDKKGIKGTFEITSDAAYESIIVNYERYKRVSRYVILYGKQSGQYENTIYDVTSNQYKGGGHMFAKDKFAFSVKIPGKYYIKMLAVSEGTILAESNETEIEVH